MSAHDLIMQIGRTARRRMRQMRELRQISQMEARQFGDLALTRSDLMTLAGGAADARERLEKTAEKLGIPAIDLRRERWRALDMARACANCERRGLCRRWQAGEGNREDYRLFCPNAADFAELDAESKLN